MLSEAHFPTALGARIMEAGLHPRLIAFDIAIAKLLNAGGTIEEALARLANAEQRLRGCGHGVGGDQPHDAAAPQQSGGAGPAQRADNKGQRQFARPAREPSSTDRAAMRLVRRETAKIVLTVFDSFRLRDGRAIGDLRFGEIESLRFENAREASILRQIQRHIAHAAADAKIRDIMKAEDLQRFIQRGAEVADVG